MFGIAPVVLFYFGGNSLYKEFPSPCYLFTATEVIENSYFKNARCCGLFFKMFLGIGKPVKGFPDFYLSVEIRDLHLVVQPSKKGY